MFSYYQCNAIAKSTKTRCCNSTKAISQSDAWCYRHRALERQVSVSPIHCSTSSTSSDNSITSPRSTQELQQFTISTMNIELTAEEHNTIEELRKIKINGLKNYEIDMIKLLRRVDYPIDSTVYKQIQESIINITVKSLFSSLRIDN